MGTEVAVKIYTQLKPEADFTRIYNECKLYQLFSDRANPTCNAFLKYYGAYTQGESVCLVMEYVENNIIDFLIADKHRKHKITDIQLLSILYKLIVSFAEMEELGVCHGDIKPHHLFIDNNWNIKIIDYSISFIADKSLIGGTTFGLHPLQGTKAYMAPEIIGNIIKGKHKAYFEMSKADVFSLGISFLHMLSLLEMLTFNDYTDYNTKKNNHLLMGVVDKLQYPWARKILRLMLNVNPDDRLKFKDLLFYLKDIHTRNYNL